MKAATSNCHAEALVARVVQTPAELQRHLDQMLKIAQSMRAHGVPGFPDSNSQGAFWMSPSVATAPGYLAAAKTCGGPSK